MRARSMMNMMEIEIGLQGKPIDAIQYKTNPQHLNASSACNLTNSKSLNYLSDIGNHRGATDMEHETSFENPMKINASRLLLKVASKERMNYVSQGLPGEKSCTQRPRRISTPQFIEMETSIDGTKNRNYPFNFPVTAQPREPQKLSETVIDR